MNARNYLVVIATLGTFVGTAARGAGPVVAALQVQRPQAEELQMNFFGQAGTQMAVVIDAPRGEFVKVDEEKSKLTSATDDKGTDLTKPADGAAGRSWTSAFFAKVSADGKRVAIPISLPASPAAGARVVTIDATIAIDCGLDPKPHEAKPAKLANNATLVVGPVRYKVVKLGEEPRMTPGGTAISLQTNEASEAVKTLRFVDAAGKEIKSKSAGQMSGGFGGKMTYTIDYELEGKVDTLGLKADVYDKVETVDVPLKLTVGIGL